MIVAQAPQQNFAASDNHGQQIVEIMSNAAGQPADGFHSVGGLQFELPAFGDVANVEEQSRLSLIVNFSGSSPDWNGSPVGLEAPSFKIITDLCRESHEAATLFRRDQVHDILTD